VETPESLQQHLAAIVEGSDDAIITKGLDSVIRSWNPGAERMFGYSAEEVIGHPITLLFPDDRKEEEVDFIARLRRGEKITQFETVRKRKDGTLFPVSLTVSPVRDADGNIVAASKIARDITVRRASEERQEQMAREGEALLAVSHKLLEDVSLEIFTQFCLDTICDVAGMEAGHLQVIRGHGEKAHLHPTGTWHLAHAQLEPIIEETNRFQFSFGEGLPGLAWQTKQLQFIDDVTGVERFLRWQVFTEVGLLRAVALPVWQGGEICAIMEFFGSSEAKLDSDTLRMIETIGSQIGVAIQRKQEADERETLRREMSHRVGNSLSVLASIYRSCSRVAHSKDELDEAFLGRLIAIGQANRLAIENATEGAPLPSLIRKSIDIFPSKDHVEIKAVDLQVCHDSVMPLALILNELATNSLKHNDLTADGRLSITAHYDDSAQHVLLKWAELHAVATATLPPEPSRVGFGTQLMKFMIENKLGGGFHRQIDTAGIRVEISLPRDRVEA
jgi:PAS domain S-box-containing protein